MAHCLFIFLNQRGNPVEPNRIRSLDRSCPFGITTYLVVIKLRTMKFSSNSIISFYQDTLSNFRLLSQVEMKNFAAQKSPVPPKRDGASRRSRDWEKIVSSKNSQFEADNVAAGINNYQTFTIILPNLIHRSKKRNLPPRGGFPRGLRATQ